MAARGRKIGRPKGAKDKPDSPRGKVTRSKIEARQHLIDRVIANLDPMLDAQFHNAQGIKHFFLRDQSGKFVMIDDPSKIEVALNSGEEGSYYWIFTKDPSVQAFTDLMNRALDKPSEHLDVQHSGSVDLVTNRLHAARKRLTS
jgi:hypothetical protein